MREVPALARGLRILDLLSTHRTGLRVNEIAANLEIPRSATYELVYTLRKHRVVDVDAAGLVVLGSKLFAFGNAYASTVDIAQLAAAASEEARNRLNETVQVGILDGAHVFYIAKAESTQPLRLVSSVGRKLPAQCTGIGKVLLAWLDPDSLQQTLEQVEWRALTPNSIMSIAELEEELERVRERGWAFDDCESNEDVCCVAAPVRDQTGNVVVAISVSFPVSRLSDERRAHFAAVITSVADEFSASLGFSPSANWREQVRS